eukprot:jgi/Tetstr1/426743/TSEL_001680.t1
MWHMLQGAVSHYLRDCEECDAPADNEECRRVNECIKTQREEGFDYLLTYAQMCSMYFPDEMWDVKCVARGSGTTDTERAYGRQFLLEALRIKFLRACLDQDFRSLPLWRPGFVGQWEAFGADDAVDMFEGTGPGYMGAVVEPCT